MEYEMKEGRPKTWDKTKRFYEISHPNGKKEIWKDIRKDHKIDRHNAILNLVCAGIELKEEREIVDKQIREEEAMFRSEAYNEITKKQKLMIKELGLGE